MPEARLDLQARALAGGEEDVRDFILSCAWQKLEAVKGMNDREKVAAFAILCSKIAVKVEAPARG